MGKVFFLSGFFSFFWSVVFLILGRVFDNFMPHYISTAIASLATATGNFFVQFSLFAKNRISFNHAFKYACLAVAETFTIALVAHEIIKRRKYIDKKLHVFIKNIEKEWKQYFNTIARTIAGLICFIIVSYPLRKLWVFH
tara:strand:+ start:1127 stop:1546 length:420 start_codon:yes stop_codon:yes gene_type:complete